MISGCLVCGGQASPLPPTADPPPKASDHCFWGFFCANGWHSVVADPQVRQTPDGLGAIAL
jgi:hypothetical protein